MKDRDQLSLGFRVDVIARAFRRAETTREKGRRYERTEVCPKCFRAFTPKGIARHVAACRAVKR